MTPQEQALISELFDRLASLENNPRDPEAERAIADGLRRAPHAAYALVQTALVQDEALKRANARIEELEAQFGGEPEQHQGSFLDSMREAVLGRREPRGSVPSVRSPATQTSPMGPPPLGQPPMGQPPFGQSPFGGAPGYYPQMPGGPPPFGSGGSFLGTAASTAAGVVGGALLMDGIRSMFGHHTGAGTSTQSAFGGLGNDRSTAGSSSDSNLAREAGINDIDRGGDRQGAADFGNRQQDLDNQQQDLDNQQQDVGNQQQDWDTADDFADDDGSFSGDDSDFA
jgi:uncharacterized protein